MCPEQPAFYTNTIWKAIFDSRFQFWWCDWYYNHAWLISLGAIFAAGLTLLMIFKIQGDNPKDTVPAVSTEGSSHSVKERLRPLWWVTTALVSVSFVSGWALLTTIFPNWTIWALGSRDYDGIYALSHEGVQFVLDSLEWTATAGLLSFGSATLTGVAVVLAFWQQIKILVRRNSPQQSDGRGGAQKVKQTGRSSKSKIKSAPETEWIAFSKDSDPTLQITVYREPCIIKN